MADPAKRRATYDDLVAVPDHLIAEIVDGELLVNPRPAVKHTRASSRLGSRLGGPFDDGRGGPGGWIILEHDRGSKRTVYARENVNHIWLVDPEVRMLEVFRLLPSREYV